MLEVCKKCENEEIFKTRKIFNAFYDVIDINLPKQALNNNITTKLKRS